MRLTFSLIPARGFRIAFLALLSLMLLATASPRRSTIASAQKAARRNERVRVTDAILGVRLGSTLEEAREKLKGLRKSGGEGESEGESESEGGRKVAWILKKSAYNSIAYQADAGGRVQWVTGFLRRGREIPFSKLGDLSFASSKSDQGAVWNVQRPEGNFRLIARGSGGKASVVHLLTLKAPSTP